jgi:pimeloyl-ACP methyl ester carboxylesterase
MKRATVIVLALAALSLPMASSSAAARPRLFDRDCGVINPTSVTLTCHTLVVPENRAKPRAGNVRLAVMVMHARASEPEPDPVVFLAGGPGGSGIQGFESFAESPMLENRDLILLDQRGTGASQPSLDCPELAQARVADFSRADSHDDELAALRDAAQECRERLADNGVDLDAYDTVANARDVEDLRKALEIDEWNLYGVSYGSRLALEVMRSYPDGVRTAVLDSVYPPDVDDVEPYTAGVDAAFDRLVKACAADDGCATTTPDLAALIDQMVDRYNNAPAEASVAGGAPLVVNGYDVLAGVWNAMYDSEIIPALPNIVAALANGDTSILPVFADSALEDQGAEGMFISVECADNGLSKADAKTIEDPPQSEVILRFSAQSYCELWDVERLPKSFNRVTRSKIPAIVFAGSLDPITAASGSRRVAKTLRNATYVELAGLGHVVTKVSDCAREIRQEFLEDPTEKPDVTCADEPAPPFLSQGLI